MRLAREYLRQRRKAKGQTLPSKQSRKFALLVSGCPGGPRKYRCEHLALTIEHCGLEADVLDYPGFALSELVENYDVFVLQRTPMDAELERFLERAEQLQKRVIFDTDDLVWKPALLDQTPGLSRFGKARREVRRLCLEGIAQSMAACQSISVSTPGLVKEVELDYPDKRLHLIPNLASPDLVSRSLNLDPREPTGDRRTVLGYFSGTPTHDEDLDLLAEPLARLFDEEDVELLLVGDLSLPRRWQAYRDRIRHLPRVPWQKLPGLLQQADLHLVPLTQNRFSECKSEIKFIEAALVGRACVASPVGPWKDLLESSELGQLCDGKEDWYDILGQLLHQPERVLNMGAAAKVRALDSYQLSARATALVDYLQGCASGQASRVSPPLGS